ncbi:MAG: c-di-GMP-binding flagellar brake protein YcgR [Crocinitomicaceae bacterium]|jgi:c-di-GMP-binding flagellar brake protein YcgR
MAEEEERRRYFRIDDEVALSFTLLADEKEGGNEDLNQEFHMSLEVQIRHAMADLRSQSSKVAYVLDLMNQKINLLRSTEEKDGSAPVLKGANLSACGIAFTWHENLPINQQLMVNLYLQPNHELIRTEAHVAGVAKNEDTNAAQEEFYIVRLDFDNIQKNYQELLIQHVVQRQGHQLRKRLDN